MKANTNMVIPHQLHIWLMYAHNQYYQSHGTLVCCAEYSIGYVSSNSTHYEDGRLNRVSIWDHYLLENIH